MSAWCNENVPQLRDIFCLEVKIHLCGGLVDLNGTHLELFKSTIPKLSLSPYAQALEDAHSILRRTWARGVVVGLDTAPNESPWRADAVTTQAAENIARMKKAAMAARAEELLAGTRWLPEPLRTTTPA